MNPSPTTQSLVRVHEHNMRATASIRDAMADLAHFRTHCLRGYLETFVRMILLRES